MRIIVSAPVPRDVFLQKREISGKILCERHETKNGVFRVGEDLVSTWGV